MKKIAILGSTGSTGIQILEVVRYNKNIQMTALATGSNVKLLEEQIREFKPRLACLRGKEKVKELRAAVANTDVKMADGMGGLMEAAATPGADLVVTAVVGTIGIRPATAAMGAGKDVALASKEILVTAGHTIIPLAREEDVKLLSIDSEHSTIFQRLQGAAGSPPHKMLLTASGGPLRGLTREQSEKVRLEDALRHPNWPMGYKTTIDSSTTANRRLEVIEVRRLLGAEMGQVQVTVQPASTIHSMVELEDGIVIAQLDTPDMKLSVQYALYYPEHRFLPGNRLDFEKPIKISFEVPDVETFRGLKLTHEAGRRGGTLSAVFSVANEVAVAMFFEWKINYLAIVDMIEGAMEHHCVGPFPDVTQILEAEQETCDYLSSEWN